MYFFKYNFLIKSLLKCLLMGPWAFKGPIFDNVLPPNGTRATNVFLLKRNHVSKAFKARSWQYTYIVLIYYIVYNI